MVTLKNPMSLAGQHGLQDMVELQMYLIAQTQHKPWTMLPRGIKGKHEARKPYSNPVESSAVMELMDRGFIEASSSQTFIVSKSGHQYYEREMKNRI